MSSHSAITVLCRHQAQLLNAANSSSFIGRQGAYGAPCDADGQNAIRVSACKPGRASHFCAAHVVELSSHPGLSYSMIIRWQTFTGLLCGARNAIMSLIPRRQQMVQTVMSNAQLQQESHMYSKMHTLT